MNEAGHAPLPVGEAPVYLNGQYLPLAEARISVLDRGFIFGDAVYEVLPVYRGKILALERHLDRLDNSLTRIYMENPLSRRQWHNIFHHLLRDEQEPEQSLYVQVSRGAGARTHDIHSVREPTVLVMKQAIRGKPGAEGIRAITHEDIRWACCDIKSTTLLACVMLRHRAQLQEASETILLRQGELTEGAASNIFVVTTDGTVGTPPKSSAILPGITRDVLIELLQQAGLEVAQTRIAEADLRAADEIWAVSSTWEVVPVIELDGNPVGNGRPGAIWTRAHACYQDYKTSAAGG